MAHIDVQSDAGWCLWFVQEVFGVSHLYRSAYEAYLDTKYRNTSRTMPNFAVPVWFSHWGTYGTPPTYGNWGHVVAWIPERGQFLSSPGSGYGQQWFNSIGEIESFFNSTYLGWSLDISGTIIGGASMTTRADLDAIYLYGPLKRNRLGGEGEDVYLGKAAAFVLADHANSNEYKNRMAAEKAIIDSLNSQISALKDQIANTPAPSTPPPTTTPTALDQETNAIVKRIEAKLTAIFK